MGLNITARKFSLTESLQSAAYEAYNRLSRYSHLIIDTHLILERDKPLNFVELTVSVKKGFLRADTRTNDIYQGIHEVFNKVEKQLKKHYEKLRERKRLSHKTKRQI
ncbi:MAG: ribosome-associated translation inhibitor RaiA [candidate division WOR-3 bacterium]